MNNEVTLITGPYRSGTSMLTGLLELCGFDLGRSFRVLRAPGLHNPRGHLEIDYVVVLNSYFLMRTVPDDAYRDWFPILGIPDEKIFSDYCRSRGNYFSRFIDRFDGDLCKDPHFCLTLSGWKQYWKKLRKVVFCLRDPVSSAKSMSKRYDISYEAALEAWYRYADFFYRNSWDENTLVFDLVSFNDDPERTLGRLLKALNRYDGEEKIEKALSLGWSRDSIHKVDQALINALPAEIRSLYEKLTKLGGGIQ